jgi:DNA-directed RNA polymerase subunit N (RpoN/RPB10)
MIVPIRCFTCGKPIPKAVWDEYIRITSEKEEGEIEKIKQAHRSAAAARPFGQKKDLEEKDWTLEYMALNILQIQRMCCRRMYLGTIDIFSQL